METILSTEFHSSSNKSLKHSEKLRVGLGNMQSIKSKQTDLVNHINMVSWDIFLITETWINENADSIWKASSELNLNGLHLGTVDQINGKKGGGIAIAYKDNIKKRSAPISSTPLSLVYGD